MGWFGELDYLRRAIRIAKMFEPAVATLVAPSRLVKYDPENEYDFDKPNFYCRPIECILRAMLLTTRRYPMIF